MVSASERKKQEIVFSEITPKPTLKSDYKQKPLSIFTQKVTYKDNSVKDRYVMLVETFNQKYNEIKDDIVSISTAIQRCQYIHEYEINFDTLQAGISLGKTPEHILYVLQEYNKYNELPEKILNFLAPNQYQKKNKNVIYFQILDTSNYLLRIPDFINTMIRNNKSIKLPFMEDYRNYDQKIPFQRYNPNSQSARLIYKKINVKKMNEFRIGINQIIKDQYFDPDNEQNQQEVIFLEEYYETKQITENGIYQQLPEQESNIKNELYGDMRLNLVEAIKREKICDNNEEKQQIKRYLDRFDPKQVAFAISSIKYNTVAPVLNAKLKSTTSLRDYQKYAVRRVVNTHESFKDEKWPNLPSTSSYNSGMIILPCGSGKTLTGIAIAVHVQQACLVLTNSNYSSTQWKNEFKKYSTINDQNIFVFQSGNVDNGATIYQPGFHQVVISTYQMLTNKSATAKAKFNQMLIRNTLFGTILFDEAHMMFADSYQKLWIPTPLSQKKNNNKEEVYQFIAAKCKVGLTATLLREDQKIGQYMQYLGVKLYEANWYELEQQGYLAPIKCIEIKVDPNTYKPDTMTQERFRELSKGGMLHTKAQSGDGDNDDNLPDEKRDEKLVKFLTKLPFSKVKVSLQLIKLHLSLSHQILLFVDEVAPAKLLGHIFHAPIIWGDVETKERAFIIEAFKQREINLIILTRVGDTSLDLPECNVLIQLSWQEGSNRQETQRMGRISRPKSSGETGYFYILVNQGAKNEVESADGRRQYITVSQGYSYVSLTEDDFKSNLETKESQYGDHDIDSENNLYKFHEIKNEQEYVEIWKKFMKSKYSMSIDPFLEVQNERYKEQDNE